MAISKPIRSGHSARGSALLTVMWLSAALAAIGFSLAGPTSFVLADKLAFCRFSYLWPPKTAKDSTVWNPVALTDNWPLAIRVEMAPLNPNSSVLQPLTVTASLHLHLSPKIAYGDF